MEKQGMTLNEIDKKVTSDKRLLHCMMNILSCFMDLDLETDHMIDIISQAVVRLTNSRASSGDERTKDAMTMIQLLRLLVIGNKQDQLPDNLVNLLKEQLTKEFLEGLDSMTDTKRPDFSVMDMLKRPAF